MDFVLSDGPPWEDRVRPSELTPEARVLRAISNMPYGGIVHGPMVPTDKHHKPAPDFEFVASYLEALRDTLRVVASSNEAELAELQRLRTIIAGGRVLLAELLPDQKEN